MASGLIGFLGVGVESSGGASSAAIVDFIPFLRESLTVTKDDLPDPSIWNAWDERKMYDGQQRVQGQVEALLHPLTAGYLLRTAFDQTTADIHTAASSGSVWEHRFTTLQTQFQCGSGSEVPTATFEVFRGPCIGTGSSFAYYNCGGNVAEIRAQAGQLVTIMLDVVGRDYSRLPRSTPAFAPAAAFLWSAASLSIAGVGQTVFEAVTVRLENNLEPVPKLDGRLRPDTIERNDFRRVFVEGTLGFQNDTDYDAFLNGTERRLVLDCQGDALPGSTFARVRVDVPRFRYSTFAPNIGGPQRIQVPFTGRGMIDPTSGYALQVTLVNTRQSGYHVNTTA